MSRRFDLRAFGTASAALWMMYAITGLIVVALYAHRQTVEHRRDGGIPCPLGGGVVLWRLLAAVVFLLPLLFMVSASLYPPGEPLPTTLRLLPAHPTLANYRRLFDLLPLGRYTLNSLLVVGLAMPITLLVSSWAGIGHGAAAAARAAALAGAVAGGVDGTGHGALVDAFSALPGVGLVRFGVGADGAGVDGDQSLLRAHVLPRLPPHSGAIYDAAQLDGAGVLRTWWSVILPMTRTTAVGVALLTFVFYWGDFVSPLLIYAAVSHATLPDRAANPCSSSAAPIGR
jgi:multiple sugar transport system permease protein